MTTNVGRGVGKLDAEQIARQNPSLIVLRHPSPGLSFYLVNVRIPPFDNAKVREAINEAMDRSFILRTNTFATGVVGGPVFPGSKFDLTPEQWAQLPGYGPNMEQRRARARQLLQEAGFGSGLQVELMYVADDTENQDKAEAMVQLLDAVGITVKLAPRARAETRTRERDGQFQMWTHGYGQPSLDPAATFGTHYLKSSGRNFHGMVNPRIEELYQQQLSLVDDEKRKPLIQEMVREAVRDSALNVLYWRDEAVGYWPYVKNVVAPPTRYSNAAKLEIVWLDR